MRIQSQVNAQSKEYRENYAEMTQLVGELRQHLLEAVEQGRPKDIVQHAVRGQLLARDRVELLLDQDSPFLELMPLAGYGQEGIPTGASMIAGIGVVRSV
jgi:acetyl-CoA carboxylase carboxyltransferase component